MHSGLYNARGFFTERNASTYDQIVRYATIGRDGRWKKNILCKVQGKIVLDLASGTGILSEMIRNGTDALEVLRLGSLIRLYQDLQGQEEGSNCDKRKCRNVAV